MAKIDSTAVNELIDLGNQRPLASDPNDDMLFAQPAATLPPLPQARSRSATGTGTLTSPPAPPPQAMRPSRQMSVVPAPRDARDSQPPPLPSAARTSKPSLPPPIRATQQRAAEGTPMPERITPELAPPPRRPTAPPVPARMPVAAPFDNPFEASANDDMPMEVAAPIVVKRAPSAPPVAAQAAPIVPFAPQDMTSNQAWFDTTGALPDADQDENWVGTMQVAKQEAPRSLVGKLAVPMGLLVIVGVFVGGYFAFNGEGGKSKVVAKVEAPAAIAAAAAPVEAPKAEPAAVAPVAEPTPAPVAEPVAAAPIAAAPVAAEPTPTPAPAAVAPTPAPAAVEPTPAKAEPAVAVAAPQTPPNLATAPAVRPALVDVRIDSKPSGATVMLVDQGKTTFLGTTPVSASVDPSRTYDLVFTYASKPTQIEHLDPRTQTRLDITLGKQVAHTEVAAAPAPAHHDAPAPAHHEVAAAPAPAHHDAPAPAPHHETPAPAPKRVAAAAPAAGGQGVLMISSKPPCEIFVDGKATGLRTPQRSIPLAAGNHSITLVDAAANIKKTVAVQITADKPTKVIQDLMKH